MEHSRLHKKIQYGLLHGIAERSVFIVVSLEIFRISVQDNAKITFAIYFHASLMESTAKLRIFVDIIARKHVSDGNVGKVVRIFGSFKIIPYICRLFCGDGPRSK